ncbi:MAG: hypothetical protein Q8P41_27135 [Pseudomonadota bacterium]|nr:hypothetical protein [Pseudomonadota bacterium]
MLLSLLAACTPCPTFAETVTTDPDGVGDAAVYEGIAQGIADFAAWTGRAGVCVPEVQVRADVWPEYPSVIGRYQGSGEPILVEPEATEVARVVRHELCHALDTQEDHSAPNEDLFPTEATPKSDLYPTDEARSRETFADACEAEPTDIVLAQVLGERCSRDLVPAPTRYLHETVWTGVEPTPISDTPRDIGIIATDVTLDPDLYVDGVAGLDGALVLGVNWFVLELDRYVTGLVRVDTTTGALSARIELPRDVEHPGQVVVAASDGDVVAFVQGETLAAYRVDLDTGAAEPIPLSGLPDYVEGAAVSEGALYVHGYAHRACVTGWCTEPVLLAYDLDSAAPIDLPSPGRVWSVRPAVGGIEAHTDAGFARYERIVGTWDILPAPYGIGGFARLSEHERVFAYAHGDLRGTVVLDLEARSWHLASDPCGTGAFGGRWADVGDAPYLLGGYYAEDGAPVPLYALSPA